LKQIRLLPVVIVAACALFLLKGVGIMTHGGYVLVGTTSAGAAGDAGGDHGGREASTATAKDAAEPTLTLPAEPTISDLSPTIEDGTPTLPLSPDPDPGAAEGAHGAEAGTAEETAVVAEPGAEDHTEVAAAEGEGVPPAEEQPLKPLALGEACPPVDAAGAVEGEAEGHDAAAAEADDAAAVEPEVVEAADAALAIEGAPATDAEGLDFITPRVECETETAVNEHGDALPQIMDSAGNLVPMEGADGAVSSQNALLQRLSERRDDLDAREDELDMRMALVEAAEKRIEERTAVLEALEGRINAMVDEKRTLEESQFVALVAMYETMKPKDAAAIFDQLDLRVLLRVARAINPRKMAPIMAKMDPMIAKELTAGLAVDRVEPTIELGHEDLAALPQIVGQ
jgi:flagellar motility protein MotE (MotC chaperone)